MRNSRKLKVWLRLEHGRASATARACGVSRQAVSNWVLGKSIPSIARRADLDRLTGGKVGHGDWPETIKPGPKAKT